MVFVKVSSKSTFSLQRDIVGLKLLLEVLPLYTRYNIVIICRTTGTIKSKQKLSGYVIKPYLFG